MSDAKLNVEHNESKFHFWEIVHSLGPFMDHRASKHDEMRIFAKMFFRIWPQKLLLRYNLEIPSVDSRQQIIL